MTRLLVSVFKSDPQRLSGGYAPFATFVAIAVETGNSWLVERCREPSLSGRGSTKKEAIEDLKERLKALYASPDGSPSPMLTVTASDGAEGVTEATTPHLPGTPEPDVIAYQEMVNQLARRGDQLLMFGDD